MPERKGRKRRPADRRRGDGAPVDASPGERAPETAPTPSRQTPPSNQPPLPSPTARASGLLIAVITAFFAVLVLRDGLTEDHTAIDATLRIFAGISLILLSLAVGALVLFPEVVRGLLARGRR